jgi:hypothetical protein
VSGIRPTYLDKFVKDAHRLVAMSYDRIHPRRLRKTQEEVITQRIVDEINAMIDSGAEKWMQRYYVSDNPPISGRGRYGKDRKKVDIEIVLTRHIPRPRFHFEAKRLGPEKGVPRYLGIDGLGCFTTGEYASGSDEAGMLGYVQSDACPDWAKKIEASLAKRPERYDVVKGTTWEPHGIITALPYSYRTRHERPSLGRSVWVYHTLLLFTSAAAN